MKAATYQLSQSLKGHSGSVRTLSLSESGALLSGSWDGTCSIAFFDPGLKQYVSDKTLVYHSGPVYSSCAMFDIVSSPGIGRTTRVSSPAETTRRFSRSTWRATLFWF